MPKSKDLGGRPPKYGKALSDPLGLRLPIDLIEKIDKAAEERGWTRIDEIRRRLAESFSPLANNTHAVADAIDLIVAQLQELTGRADIGCIQKREAA